MSVLCASAYLNVASFAFKRPLLTETDFRTQKAIGLHAGFAAMQAVAMSYPCFGGPIAVRETTNAGRWHASQHLLYG